MAKFSRRETLSLLAGFAAISSGSLAFAQGLKGKKFVFVILRGAMDGLSALMPDDPLAEAARGSLLPPKAERLDIATGFHLHPSLSSLHASYQTGEAAFIHACASPYRERSHFDGQDVLEVLGKTGEREGWLNRALQFLPDETGLGIGPALPMVLRGGATTTNWSPSVFAEASDDLLNRLQTLYTDDPGLASSLATARDNQMTGMSMGQGGGPQAAVLESFKAAGQFMTKEGGPGIAVISVDGWDTHANQSRLLPQRFTLLDQGLSALQTELASDWSSTVIVLASEFGRTFAANGSDGTDHGTGGLVTLLGGAVEGGRLFGEWPGLKQSALYEGRDLFPANDLVAVLKGVLRDHLGIERQTLDRKIFTGNAKPMDGLIKS